MLLARIACPICGDDYAHRVAHDDLDAPDPRRVWAYRCPESDRLAIVGVEWMRIGRQPHTIELSRPPATLLDLLPAELPAALGGDG